MRRKLRQKFEANQPEQKTQKTTKEESDGHQEADLRAARAARRSSKMFAEMDKSNNEETLDKSVSDTSANEKTARSDEAMDLNKESEVSYIDLTKIDSYTTVEGDCLVCQRRFHSRLLFSLGNSSTVGFYRLGI